MENKGLWGNEYNPDREEGIMRKKRYSVDLDFYCRAHYCVDAKDEQEAIELAYEMDSELTKEEWVDKLKIYDIEVTAEEDEED